MQLHPREKFTVTRQLQNPYITDTFYVRAVIRNAKTDAIITTLNLTDRTGQRFSKDWIVPSDPTGLGFYISIVTSVYDDSGYTTKTQNYGDEENTYLVQDRYVFNPNYPVGADIDYKRIKKMIDEAVAKIQLPEQKVVTVTNTKEVVKEVRVPEVKVVETQKVQDLSSIIRAIEVVGKKVDDKEVTEVPEQEEIDLEPIAKKIESIEKETIKRLDSILKTFESTKFEIQLNPKVDMPKVSEPVKSPMQDERITRLMKSK